MGRRAGHPGKGGRAAEIGILEKAALICLQRPCLFWNHVGGENIYPIAPGPDKVHNTVEPEREQKHPHPQRQTLPSTKQAEAGEVVKVKCDEAEE